MSDEHPSTDGLLRVPDTEPKRVQLTPQFFINDDTGEPWQLIGSVENQTVFAKNLDAYLRVAIQKLIDQKDGDHITLIVVRKDMTPKEVMELPEE